MTDLRTENLPPQGAPVRLWGRALRSRNLVIGLLLTLVFALAALISFVWTPYDVTKLVIADRLQAPSNAHWFGTDHFGRDILSMIMVGSRNSIAVALIAD